MKIAGVVFVLLSSCSVGFRVAAGLKKRCGYLREFINTLHLMRNELIYLHTPLPVLFSAAAKQTHGNLWQILNYMSEAMEKNRWTSPIHAAENALSVFPDDLLGDLLLKLAKRLGSYDTQAQLAGIDIVCDEAACMLHSLEAEMGLRSKTYKLLSICAGIALVILLI